MSSRTESSRLARRSQRRARGRPRCRLRRTAARTRCAGALRREAASSARTTRDCSDRRTRSRCRTARPSGAGPSTARATAAASAGRSASPRSDRPSCPGSSPCSRSTSPWPRSGTPRWTSRACPGYAFFSSRLRDHRELIDDRRERLERGRELASACPRLAASTAAGRIPSACRRSRGAAPAWPASWRAPSSTAPWRRAAAAPRSRPCPAGTSGAAMAFLVMIIATSSSETACSSRFRG